MHSDVTYNKVLFWSNTRTHRNLFIYNFCEGIRKLFLNFKVYLIHSRHQHMLWKGEFPRNTFEHRRTSFEPVCLKHFCCYYLSILSNDSRDFAFNFKCSVMWDLILKIEMSVSRGSHFSRTKTRVLAKETASV